MSEAALAWRFGATGIVDAYRVNVLLLLYGQQFFVSSILPFVLVPIFAECRTRGKEEEAWAVADSVAGILLIFGFIISTALFFRPDLAIDLIAPGLASPTRLTAIYFMHWCGLGFLPICWTGAASGTLFAFNAVQIGGLSQLASNAAMLLAIVVGGFVLGPNCLIVGVLGGAVVSTLICNYKLRQIRRKFAPHGKSLIRLSSVKRALRVAAPLVGAVVIGQSTSVVIARVLSHLAEGSLASFGYAWKMGLIVQLVPTAMAAVLFPRLSENWFSNDRDCFGPLCARIIRAALFISIPLMCICFVQRISIISIVLGRGAFNGTDVRIASELFGLMIIGAPASTVVVSLSRAFYAAQQAKLPVLTDICGNLCELALIPNLTGRFGLRGAAFAYMLLPWVTGSGLLVLFIRRNRTFPAASFFGFAVKVFLTASACAWLGSGAASLVSAGMPGGFVLSAVRVSVTSVLTLSGFLFITHAMGLPEAFAARDVGRKLALKFQTVRSQAA